MSSDAWLIVGFVVGHVLTTLTMLMLGRIRARKALRGEGK